MKIYIAGKITGDRHYKRKFKKAERTLKRKGHSVFNPAVLTDYPEFSWNDYMKVTGAMQKCCEATYFLPDWKNSKGARQEYDNAVMWLQHIFFSLKDVPENKKN